MSGPVLDGKYELLRLLGEGGMGDVYEARHVGTGRSVAVKILRGQGLEGNPEVVERFHREARAVGSLDTPHVVQVLDTGKDAATGSPYMVMELLSGEDLGRVVARLGPLPPEVALRVVAQACLGLERAHAAGIIHRDIKPANIFLARSRGEIVVKVVDFGVAKVAHGALGADQDQALTRTGTLVGSPLYMSPEQAKGLKTVDRRTDIWSLGCVLYEALCGRSPYAHVQTLGQIILALCSQPPQPVQDFAPWVRPDVAAIVHGCLYLDVDKRFATVLELHAAIRELLGGDEPIEEAALRPLSDAERATPAARYAGAQTRILGSAGKSDPVGLPLPVAVPAGGAREEPEEPRRVSPWLLFMLAALAVIVVGWRYVVRATHTATDEVDHIGGPPPHTVPDRVTAASTKAEVRTVYVGVTPPTARVEVDGTSVELDHGVATITGELGSVHHVAIKVGSKTSVSDVALAPDGPSPPRVAFDPRARQRLADAGTK